MFVCFFFLDSQHILSRITTINAGHIGTNVNLMTDVIRLKMTFSMKLLNLLTMVLLKPDMPRLCKQCSSRSVEANKLGYVLLVIKYVNLYQKPGSSNLILICSA